MRTDCPPPRPACTLEEIDEAAVWIARLHAPDRTLQMERGFRRWLAGSPSRAKAFETVSAGWELAGTLQRKPFPRASRWQRAGFREGFIRASAVAAAASVLIVIATLLFEFNDAGIATEVGEQRVVTLEDGTRITLNTATRIVTEYDERERKVELRSGEALFEVVKKDGWPFVVIAGGNRITALGTAFVVRRDAKRTSVALVEGKVVVAAEDDGGSRPASAGTPRTLAPGQRLTFANDQVSLDEPGIQKMMAWRWGQVEFEDTLLEAAAEEMNRYSTVKLSIASPEAKRIRVNGVFRTGDTANFAAALAVTYGLTLESTPDAIILEDVPGTSSTPAR